MMMNHRYILFTGLMVTALCIHAQDIELQTKENTSTPMLPSYGDVP